MRSSWNSTKTTPKVAAGKYTSVFCNEYVYTIITLGCFLLSRQSKIWTILWHNHINGLITLEYNPTICYIKKISIVLQSQQRP